MNSKHQPESTADELGSAAPSFYHMLRRIVARANGSTDAIMEAVIDEIAYENDEFEDEAERVKVARLVEVADELFSDDSVAGRSADELLAEIEARVAARNLLR